MTTRMRTSSRSASTGDASLRPGYRSDQDRPAQGGLPRCAHLVPCQNASAVLSHGPSNEAFFCLDLGAVDDQASVLVLGGGESGHHGDHPAEPPITHVVFHLWQDALATSANSTRSTSVVNRRRPRIASTCAPSLAGAALCSWPSPDDQLVVTTQHGQITTHSELKKEPG